VGKQEKREMIDQNKNKKHIPVLLSEVLLYLLPKEGNSYLDLTAGYGGHAEAVLERTLRPERATLVDRDRDAIEHLHERFGKGQGPRIIHKDYLRASIELNAKSAQFDMILADIGVSSPHLNSEVRGFSFNSEGPLDMRMDQSQDLTAETIVKSYSQPDLENLLRVYGEEPNARKIAEFICKNRPITTTTELATVTSQAVKKRYKGRSKVHPATKTFQALRIAVNDELAQLEQSLPVWLNLLAPKGRLAVICFHSLEDRIVKQFFKEYSIGLDSPLSLLTKKPVMASEDEIVINPRARSAKLRAVVKK
jgi:16S rRNA (cytosine1402-N4)-methyltransferase